MTFREKKPLKQQSEQTAINIVSSKCNAFSQRCLSTLLPLTTKILSCFSIVIYVT